MKLNTLLYIICAAAMMTAASCRSSKEVQSQASTPAAGTTTQKKQSAPTVKPEDKGCVTARVKVRLVMSGKDISTTGMLRMRWNDVIQLTLVDPILGITEVGRMELSANDFLIIDRINKRYVQAAYSEIPALRDQGIDFAALQSRFWNETARSDDFSFSLPLSKPVQIDLKLSNKNKADDWSGHTTVSGKYTKVSADRLLSSMMQLAQ